MPAGVIRRVDRQEPSHGLHRVRIPISLPIEKSGVVEQRQAVRVALETLCDVAAGLVVATALHEQDHLLEQRFVEARRADIPKVKSHEIHFAIGRGTRHGLPTKVTVRVIGKPHPLYDDYIDATTSMNCSIGVQQILQQPLRPGVWAPEEVFDPAAYLAEVRRRHFEVSVETVSEEQP